MSTTRANSYLLSTPFGGVYARIVETGERCWVPINVAIDNDDDVEVIQYDTYHDAEVAAKCYNERVGDTMAVAVPYAHTAFATIEEYGSLYTRFGYLN